MSIQHNISPSAPPNRGSIRRSHSKFFLALAIAASCSVAIGGLTPVPAKADTSTLIADSMSRETTKGWGSPNTGASYAVSNPERFSVGNGQGQVHLLPGKTSFATVAIKKQNISSGVDVSFDSVPKTGSIYAHVSARQTSNSEYTASLRLLSSGVLRLELSKTVNGNKSVLSSEQIATGVKAGMAFHLDFEIKGTSPTILQARAYKSGSPAPDWQINQSEVSGIEISNGGNTRLGGYLSSSAGNSSGLHFDNFTVEDSAHIPEPDRPEGPAPQPTPDSSPKPAPVPETPKSNEDSSVKLPSNAIYVSARGSDAASGSVGAPIKSVGTAIAKATSGQTIVVRAGTYHESVVMPTGKTLHLRNYPGETVWLDGSELVSGFTSASTGWVKSGWDHSFDTSPTYTRGAKDSKQEAWGFVNSAYPLAAHPDQVWIDGTRQKQVGSLSQLTTNTFYVDTSAKKLYLGSNPTGKSVSASTLVKALSIRGDKSSVQGINVRKFAPSVPDMAAVTAEKPGVLVKDLTIEDSATTGLNVSSTNNIVQNVKIQRSGMLGMNAVYADGLVVSNLTSTGNNHERFNSSPVSGGLKVGRTRGLTVKNSRLNNNYGPGLWIDESVYDSKIVNNDLVGNTGHGMSLEISAKIVVANNRILDNSGNAIKLNNSSDVSIWNNTISGKNRVLNIVQDKRRGANKSDPGHDPRQTFPDPTMPWIIKNIDVKNNVLSNTGGGNSILAVEDFSAAFTAEQMKISLDSNMYHRTGATNPSWTVVWSKGAGNPSVYTTLSAFVKAKAKDQKSFEITTGSVVGADQNPTSAVTSKNGEATALPSAIAQLTGQTTNTKRIGNFPR